MSRQLGDISPKEIAAKLAAREASSSTALSPFFALPHIIVEGKEKFTMLMVRSREGIRFSDQAEAVHALCFLSGSMDQRHFHLVVISALAQIVQHPSFEKAWMEARDVPELRRLLHEFRSGKKGN